MTVGTFKNRHLRTVNGSVQVESMHFCAHETGLELDSPAFPLTIFDITRPVGGL